MRIKDIDDETMAKDYHEMSAEKLPEMKAAQRVGADGVQVFRVS